eukprot:TRINITY_DN2037_c0_g3_i2.p1 TRINITY_DN2037_c0_g3~~TRINITY_DN2037_c0_g3_i2.p1  ORF type:complete len:214 (-),score=39.21 TRINITY_DN2037_c0_g3_i2:31-672(-)
MDGFTVVVLQGRFHYYEGYSLDQVTYPTRVLGAMQCKGLIVTNAAGAINPGYAPGDIMLIKDHINMTGNNPLIGPNYDSQYPRFPDMSNAYDNLSRFMTKGIAAELGITLREGVYAGVAGPSYETPAEIKMLRTLGADAVGMSTVPEVIVAKHMKMGVTGLSLLSNMGAGMSSEVLTHEGVIEVTNQSKEKMVKLLQAMLKAYFEKERHDLKN